MTRTSDIRDGPQHRRTHIRASRTVVPVPRLLALLAVGLLTVACGSDDEPATAADRSSTSTEHRTGEVTIERSRFEPLTLMVGEGTTVEFTNLDPYDHTVTSTDGSPLAFDSGDLAEGEVFEQRFDDAGSFDYFCEIHPTMRATVVVG